MIRIDMIVNVTEIRGEREREEERGGGREIEEGEYKREWIRWEIWRGGNGSIGKWQKWIYGGKSEILAK